MGTNKFSIDNKTVTVYPAPTPSAPVVYINTFDGDAAEIHGRLRLDNFIDFSLVVISNIVWDHDMAPWDCPPLSSHDVACTGGADDYLNLLVHQIVPSAENFLDSSPSWRGLAGYSLAGLFAFYSAFKTDIFTKIASMSGSFWFPKFKDYVFQNLGNFKAKEVYFSLGTQEAHTRNPMLKDVQINTEAIYELLVKENLKTTFVMNPGNHFHDTTERTIKGIEWILVSEQKKRMNKSLPTVFCFNAEWLILEVSLSNFRQLVSGKPTC